MLKEAFRLFSIAPLRFKIAVILGLMHLLVWAFAWLCASSIVAHLLPELGLEWFFVIPMGILDFPLSFIRDGTLSAEVVEFVFVVLGTLMYFGIGFLIGFLIEKIVRCRSN